MLVVRVDAPEHAAEVIRDYLVISRRRSTRFSGADDRGARQLPAHASRVSGRLVPAYPRVPALRPSWPSAVLKAAASSRSCPDETPAAGASFPTRPLRRPPGCRRPVPEPTSTRSAQPRLTAASHRRSGTQTDWSSRCSRASGTARSAVATESAHADGFRSEQDATSPTPYLRPLLHRCMTDPDRQSIRVECRLRRAVQELESGLEG